MDSCVYVKKINPKKPQKKTKNDKFAWTHAFMSNLNPKKTRKQTKNDKFARPHAFMSKSKIRQEKARKKIQDSTVLQDSTGVNN